MNKNKNCETKECKTVVEQSMEICTPFKLEPMVWVGDMVMECLESEIRKRPKNDCQNRNSCEFMVKQTIKVEIPICYSVQVAAGDNYIECDQQINKC